jgi:hypothetical protein
MGAPSYYLEIVMVGYGANESGIMTPVVPQKFTGDWRTPGLFAIVVALRHQKGWHEE